VRPAVTNMSLSYGECVDLYAPGSSITSLGFGSDTATAIMSGTSMSSPHVTGVAALYLEEHPGASPRKVAKAIKKQSTKGVLSGLGAGSPNKLLFSLVR
jgi:subtilisin family serine protease